MKLQACISLLFLPEQQLPARELAEDFDSGDILLLCDKYEELFEGYDSIEQVEADIQDGVINAGVLLVWYMASQGLLLQMEACGEEEEGLLAAYINYRLEVLGADAEVDADDFYERLHASGGQVLQSLPGGNYTPLLLRYLAFRLAPLGYRLLQFDLGSGQYEIGVFPQKTAARLAGRYDGDIFVLDIACM